MKNRKALTCLGTTVLLALATNLASCGTVTLSTSVSAAESSLTSAQSNTSSAVLSPSSSAPVTTSAQDKAVDHIAIKSGSLDTKILKDATVNYSGLVVVAYNAEGEILGEITTGNFSKNNITYTSIDTSVVTDDAIFTLTWVLNGKTLTATLHYSVEVTYNLTVTDAVLADGSVAAVYYVGDTPDYSTIKVKLLNSDKLTLSTIDVTDSRLTHTNFDLSAEGTGKQITIVVTLADGKKFTFTASYAVKDAELKNPATGWTMSARYSAYTASYNSATDVKSSTAASNTFMEQAPYVMGNYNAVNLAPTIHALSSGSVIDYAKLHDTSVKVYQEDTEVTDLTTVFESADIAALTTTGDINFKDTVTGNFSLVYSYNGSTDKTKFPDITYKIKVVSGYNVFSVKDLFVLNNAQTTNQENGGSGLTNPLHIDLTSYRAANNFPKDSSGNYITFDNGVLQADLEITKDDIPATFLWSAADDGCLAKYYGSLKNSCYLIQHVTDDAHPTFTFYGNYHKLSLQDPTDVDQSKNTGFPWIVDTTFTGKDQGTATDTQVQPTSALFSTTGTWRSTSTPSYSPAGMAFNVRDLASTGNQGISAQSTAGKNGGLIFYKGDLDSESIENCILNSYFIHAENSGYWSYTAASGTTAASISYNAPTLNLVKNRMNDTFAQMVLNYHTGTINVTDCDMHAAGGPMFINMGAPMNLTAANMADDTYLKGPGAWINVDTSTVLDNFVAGDAGWFSFMGATAQMAQIKALSALMTAGSYKGYVKTENSVTKLNLIGLNMVATGSATLADGSFYGGMTIGGTHYVDYQSGYSTLTAGIANAASDGGAAYKASLYSTDFGDLYLTQGTSSPQFKTIDSSGNAHYGAIYQASGSTSYSLVNPKMFLTSTASDGVLDSGFGTGSYLTIYTGGSSRGGSVADPTTFGNYQGSNSMSIIVALL
jgi:hypothetical protein